MANNVIYYKDYQFKSNKTYFFDNNIWIYLFTPLIGSNVDKQEKASKFFKQVYTYNSQIIVTSLILSEFSNRYLRFSFDRWKKNEQQYAADYKRDYKKTSDYQKDLNQIKDLIIKIVDSDVVQKYPDDFNNINTNKILDTFDIDFNDSYYIQQCHMNNWIFVTSDNDFDNLNTDVTIVKI